jgi:outer membrane protein assembly factor BamB
MKRALTVFGLTCGMGMAASALAADAYVGMQSGAIYRYNGTATTLATPGLGLPVENLTSGGRMLYAANQWGVVYSFDTGNNMQFGVVACLPYQVSSMAVHDDQLFIGTADGHVRRVGAANGLTLATWPVNSDVQAMVLAGDHLYVGGSNTLIYRGHKHLGQFTMVYACGGQVTAMAASESQVFAGTPTGVVYRFNRATGAPEGSFVAAGLNITGLGMDRDVLVVSGAAGELRRIDPVTGEVLGSSTVPGAATGVAVTAECRADMNNDGLLNVADFTAYLSAFAAEDPRADINDDSRLNVADFSAFLQAYAIGCP